VKNYRPTEFANVDSFVGLLKKYAVTQYRDGKPYVAECHSPLYEFWVCDSRYDTSIKFKYHLKNQNSCIKLYTAFSFFRDHSEHYAHSTYVDNVLTDLIGIEPQANNSIVINPLVPSSWDYFIAENIPYHGHNVTVVWDRNGSWYPTGRSGLQVFVNGDFVASQPSIGRMRAEIPPPSLDTYYGGAVRLENYAANVNGFGYPKATASFQSPYELRSDGTTTFIFIP
jgi:hypothetical protein